MHPLSRRNFIKITTLTAVVVTMAGPIVVLAEDRGVCTTTDDILGIIL